MNGKFAYKFDSFSKFHHSLFIKGICTSPGSYPIIENISGRLRGLKGLIWNSSIKLETCESVSFSIQILQEDTRFPAELLLDFYFADGTFDTLSIPEIMQNINSYETDYTTKHFWELANEPGRKKVLDIGGRARSGLDRSQSFHDKDVTVLDIMGGDNVDVVCDAHLMSQKLTADSFDIVFCVSVFEHLIMPWKVVTEMNKVMKKGAIGLIHTHQTIGMHDLPWDYYRFSDTAWKGLFNRHTGFEIIESQLQDIQYVIPFFWKERHTLAESSAGFEASTVLIRKIGDCKMDWPLSAAEVTEDMYPDKPDNNNHEFISTNIKE